MIAAKDVAVGQTVWFRNGHTKRIQRADVSGVEQSHTGTWASCTDWEGKTWTLRTGDLFSSAAAYHVHRFETGPWKGVMKGTRSLHDGPLEFFEAHKRYYHAFARLQLAQRVAALRVPVPAGGYTKTTTFEGRACYVGKAWGFEVGGEHELEFLEPRELAPPEHAAGDMGGALWGTWTVTMTFVPGKEP